MLGPVNTGSVLAVCDSFLDCVQVGHWLLISPFLALSVLLACCFGFASLLDEDCNPGWGDCGRPLWLLLGVLVCQRW